MLAHDRTPRSMPAGADPAPGTVQHAAAVSYMIDAAERAGVKLSAARALRVPLTETRARLNRAISALR